jgi:hypothetical protein
MASVRDLSAPPITPPYRSGGTSPCATLTAWPHFQSPPIECPNMVRRIARSGPKQRPWLRHRGPRVSSMVGRFYLKSVFEREGRI